MEYLIRLAQMHETFRRPELEALAVLRNVELEILEYSDQSPFCIAKISSDEDAAKLISRSMLTGAVYELWGIGNNYDECHTDVKKRSQHLWPQYKDNASFSFQIDSFQAKRTNTEKRDIVESFSYMAFEGPIRMENPDLPMVVLEEYDLEAKDPKRVALGRLIGESGRSVMNKYDLKKRKYISTTSMDSQLALITANMALAAPGKIFYDPFTGTGSFPIACAHFGATVVGSDIDPRSIRGKPDRNVMSNFVQYGLVPQYLDMFVSDLTNTPIRKTRWLDGIVCDPPYGVREGLRVLGSTREDLQKEVLLKSGVPAHLAPGYIPPKKAYSFDAMMDDILDFGYTHMVDNGRLSMWMPVANDEDMEIPIPSHPAMQLVAMSVQQFNRWARRLITYRRVPEAEVDQEALRNREKREEATGVTADDLNAFRRKYFQGFKDQQQQVEAGAAASS
ncbi:tRNA guanosine-2'-O-methyltransferase [Aureobasidium sp. EXF-10727]|nr:tRNA guanosine-2'-O-methyltransferase [Aureobasidium sp. EXF-10727]